MGNNMAVASALTNVEKTALAQCERTIEKGMGTFREVGRALLAVRDSRLYRRDHETFADYCQERWGFTVRRAQQLIAGSKVVEGDANNCSQILTEGQARELGRVPEDCREEVLAAAKENVGDKPLTAAAIHEAAESLMDAVEATDEPVPFEPDDEPDALDEADDEPGEPLENDIGYFHREAMAIVENASPAAMSEFIQDIADRLGTFNEMQEVYNFAFELGNIAAAVKATKAKKKGA